MPFTRLTYSIVYDIQTSYKGAVYSVKLKIEFSILNQLMNLVRGNLHDASSEVVQTTSRSRNFSRHVGNRSVIRGGVDNDVPVGAYSRMDEEQFGDRKIRLQNLKSTEVMKTMTAEVRIEQVNGGTANSPNQRRPSNDSSEMYIIEDHGKSL
jgi:hypothetical protein